MPDSRENRDEKGRFLKGHSPNPGGRPKQRAELAIKCRDMGPELLEQLREIAFGEVQAKPNERIRAVELILAYGYGKPTQMVGEDPESRFKSFADLVHAATAGGENEKD